MKKLFISTLSVLALSSVAFSEDGLTPFPNKSDFDSDGNGKVTGAEHDVYMKELNRIVAIRKKEYYEQNKQFDTNNDGEFTGEEVKAMRLEAAKKFR